MRDSGPTSVACTFQFVRAAIRDREPIGVAAGMLLRAHQYAKQSGSNPWHFAVELEEFHQVGVSRSELRWLIVNGFALHAKEISVPNAPGRTFKCLAKHDLPTAVCFVLSDDAIANLSKWSIGASKRSPLNKGELPSAQFTPDGQLFHIANLSESSLPRWDPRQQKLFLDGVLVKKFRSRAPNQEIILAAFQEEAWCRRIDDPLPPVPEQDSRRRLSDTIKYLNRNQTNELIRFHGDGTGKGVYWELQLE